MGEGTIIKTEHLSKYYRSGTVSITALDNISLEIKKGSFTSIMGESGSGKSTLLHLISGIERPSKGNIEILGFRATEFSENGWIRFRRDHMGYILQEGNLIGSLTVIKNLVLPHMLFINSEKTATAKAMDALKTVGLDSRAEVYPHELSGGQQQKISIVRALMNDPEILLADEPTGSLDRKNAAEIMDILKTLNKDRQMTVVMVTHSPDLARMTDRIITIRNGRAEG